MAIYCRDSGLSWKQYLQQQAFVDDIVEGIRRAERSITRGIDQRIWSIVVSTEALERSMGNGFDRLTYEVNEVAEGIAGLRADFNWAMSGLLHKLKIQNLLLDDIYKELRIPDFQKERRYYIEQGCKHYHNGFYAEALESFLKAEPLEKTDPFVLYSIGHIYLYQQDLLDVKKAQSYFALAGKYYTAEKLNKEAGESYLHAGIAAYLCRNDTAATELSGKACKLYPEQLEAFYNRAKFLAAQGDITGLPELEMLIRKERNYALKAAVDADFTLISNQLKELLERLRQEARGRTEPLIADFEKELSGCVFLDKPAEKEVQELLSKAKALFASDCYFDYLDCPFAVQAARKQVREFLKSHPLIKELRTLEGYSPDAKSVAFSPDGGLLARGLWDNKVKLWDVSTGKELHTLKGHSSGVSSVAFSPDAALLASGSADKTVKLWEVATGNELCTLQSHSDRVHSVAFSPDGALLASGSEDRTSKLWEVATGKVVRTLKGHSYWVLSEVFSPDGMLLASRSLDKAVQLWDVATGKILRTLKGSSGIVESVAFSPDGKLLASGWRDGTIKLWELVTGKELYTLE